MAPLPGAERTLLAVGSMPLLGGFPLTQARASHRKRWDCPLLWRSPMAPWRWKRQTAGLELLKYILAHTTDMGGLLDGNAPASLGIQKLLFIFPAPFGELAIDDDIEFLIEIVKPQACAVIGGLEIDIPTLDALVVVPKQAQDHIPLPWRCEIQSTTAPPLLVDQYPLVWQKVGHWTPWMAEDAYRWCQASYTAR